MGSGSITAFAQSVTVDALETDPYPIYARQSGRQVPADARQRLHR